MGAGSAKIASITHVSSASVPIFDDMTFATLVLEYIIAKMLHTPERNGFVELSFGAGHPHAFGARR